jgi:hypothetical protein
VTESVLGPVRPIFRVLATTILPDLVRLDEHGWAEVEGLIEDALAARPPALRRQLRWFVRVLQFLAIARYGHPFTALGPEQRARFLESVQDAPLLAIRRGFWGLRTLVYLGYYGRPEGAVAIGYRASPAGWEARR